jgi:hypothetical protein
MDDYISLLFFSFYIDHYIYIIFTYPADDVN